jgi:hypothetical protein
MGSASANSRGRCRTGIRLSCICIEGVDSCLSRQPAGGVMSAGLSGPCAPLGGDPGGVEGWVRLVGGAGEMPGRLTVGALGA